MIYYCSIIVYVTKTLLYVFLFFSFFFPLKNMILSFVTYIHYVTLTGLYSYKFLIRLHRSTLSLSVSGYLLSYSEGSKWPNIITDRINNQSRMLNILYIFSLYLTCIQMHVDGTENIWAGNQTVHHQENRHVSLPTLTMAIQLWAQAEDADGAEWEKKLFLSASCQRFFSF